MHYKSLKFPLTYNKPLTALSTSKFAYNALCATKAQVSRQDTPGQENGKQSERRRGSNSNPPTAVYYSDIRFIVETEIAPRRSGTLIFFFCSRLLSTPRSIIGGEFKTEKKMAIVYCAVCRWTSLTSTTRLITPSRPCVYLCEKIAREKWHTCARVRNNIRAKKCSQKWIYVLYFVSHASPMAFVDLLGPRRGGGRFSNRGITSVWDVFERRNGRRKLSSSARMAAKRTYYIILY